MISGVLAQSGKIVPRGRLESVRSFLDLDVIREPYVTRGNDRHLFTGVVVDADGFFGTQLPQVLMSDALLGVWGEAEAVFSPVVLIDRILAPVTLYIDGDFVYATKIAIPGVLQLGTVVSDLDVVYAASIVAPGSVGMGLVGDIETVFGCEVEGSLPLKPVLLADGDVFYVPLSRVGIGPVHPSMLQDDVVYGLISTVFELPGAVADADSFLGPKVGIPITLDGTTANVNVAVNGVTAIHTTATSDSGVRSSSVTAKTSGKFYFEVTPGTRSGANDCCGIINTVGTFSNLVTSGVNCCATYAGTGNIYTCNTTAKSLGPWTVGDVISVAVDLDNQNPNNGGKIWFRRAGGLWNNTVGADPVTGAGFLNTCFPGQAWVPAIGFGGTGTLVNDVMTANFGQQPFVFPAPNGYGIWSQHLIVAPALVNETATVETIHAPRVSPANLFPVAMFEDDVFFAPASLTGGNTGIAIFDGVNTNVAMTGGNLIATHINTTTNSGARSAALKTTGKYYFEVTMGVTTGANDCNGLLTSVGTYANLVTSFINCVAVFKSSGNIFSNNANSGKTLGVLSAGDNIGWAVDLGARRAWARRNGGLWNGDAAANPATGVGGVTIVAASSLSPVVGFGGAGTATNDQQTANFGQTLFAYVPPVDFGNWTQ